MNEKRLKIIAMTTMAIDHFAAAVVYILARRNPELKELYRTLRDVGRIAFPIYGMLLVEGFVHTRDYKRYLLSMGFLALISEIPFNLTAGRGVFLYPNHQNVFLSLFIALIALRLIKTAFDHFPARDMLRYDLTILIIALASLVAYLVRCDYKQGGIIMISVMYLYRSLVMGPGRHLYRKAGLPLLFGGMLLCAGTVLSIYSKSEYYAFFSLIPGMLCNGERGSIKHKYFYYFFYPLHLLVFGLVARWMQNG